MKKKTKKIKQTKRRTCEANVFDPDSTVPCHEDDGDSISRCPPPLGRTTSMMVSHKERLPTMRKIISSRPTTSSAPVAFTQIVTSSADEIDETTSPLRPMGPRPRGMKTTSTLLCLCDKSALNLSDSPSRSHCSRGVP